MKQIIQNYLDFKINEGRLGENTIKAYEHDLGKFSNFINEKEITQIDREDIKKFIGHLRSNSNSDIAVARKISTLRSFFNYLLIEQKIILNPLISIYTPKIQEKEPNFLSFEESQKLLETIKQNASPFYKVRDYSIVKLFLSTGMRLRELTNIKIQDINLIDKRIKITRKGGKEQYIPLNDDICKVLKIYIKQRPQIDNSCLFVSRKKRGISPSEIYHLVKKYLYLAGITNKKIAVHSLRHTVATSLLANGVNLLSIKKLLGHKRITSTEIYTHINDNDLILAVNKLNI